MRIRPDRLVLVVLVVAIAALGGTTAWAVVRATDSSTSGYYGTMMGRGSAGMMGGSGAMMMTGANGTRRAWSLNGSGPVRDIAAARARAQRFADRLDLKVGEVMQFANGFYALLVDRRGQPATEVLVAPETGAGTLEYGPAMMWNTRHGMMGGSGTTGSGGMMGDAMTGGGSGRMMGGSPGMTGGMAGTMMGRYGARPSWTPSGVDSPVDVAEARALANRWLARERGGLSAAEPDALPGYFTFHVLEKGKVAGMVSVNEQTGAVWYHWWHGRFLAME